MVPSAQVTPMATTNTEKKTEENERKNNHKIITITNAAKPINKPISADTFSIRAVRTYGNPE